MKKKGLLFSTLATICVSLVAGCGGGGDPTYQVTAEPVSNEMGIVQGSGKYKMGSKVTLKAYPNLGCNGGIPSISFTKTGAHHPSEDESIVLREATVSDDLYYYYEFDLTEESIGKYVVDFVCLQNEEGDAADDMFSKYKINYVLLDGSGAETDTVVIDNTNNEEVDSDGNRLNNNVQLVRSGGKIDEFHYVDGIDDKIQWYTKNEETNEYTVYNFETSIRSDLKLYGKQMNLTPEQMVSEALNVFRESSNLSVMNVGEKVVDVTVTEVEEVITKTFKVGAITYTIDGTKITGGSSDITVSNDGTFKIEGYHYLLSEDKVYKIDEIASIGNLDKGIDSKELLVTVSKGNGELIYVKQDNKVYVKKGLNYSYFNLGLVDENDSSTLNNSGFTTKDVTNLYKFVDASGILDEDLKESPEDSEYKYYVTKEESKVLVANKNCSVYKVKEKETDNVYMTLYIYEGILYKTESERAVNLIKYLDKDVMGMDVQNSNPMYFIKLYSNNVELNEELTEINANYNDILKIVPANGEVVESLLEVEGGLKDALKLQNYDYDIYDGQCVNPYAGETIDSNGELCLKVNASIDSVITALEEFKKGGVTLTTTVRLQGFTVGSRMFSFDIGDSAFEVTEEEVDVDNINKLHPVIYDVLGYLNDIIEGENVFHHFKYSKDEETKVETYKFYENKNDNVPVITIDIKDDKIISFGNFDGENTYVTAVTYDENIDLLLALEVLGKGSFVVNETNLVELIDSYDSTKESYYDIDYSVTKPDGFNETVWNLFKTLKEFKTNNASYTYDATTKTFTDASGNTYAFTLTDGEVTKVVYTPFEETGVEYNISEQLDA